MYILRKDNAILDDDDDDDDDNDELGSWVSVYKLQLQVFPDHGSPVAGIV